MTGLVDVIGVAGVLFTAYMITSVLMYAVLVLARSLERAASTPKPSNTGLGFHTRRREDHD